jgi:uncharacterized damage-inducible protein DinB
MNPTIPPPAPDEYASFYAGYVAEAAGHSLPEAYAAQLADLRARLGALEPARWKHRYAEGKWSVQELLGHLCDGERVFAYRLLRIGRGDRTPLAGFEENAYVAAAHSDDRTLPDLLDEFAALRQATILLAAHLPAAAWANRGTASGKEISARALAAILYGHVAHHLQVLRDRYGV